jgi:hypothetical protein
MFLHSVELGFGSSFSAKTDGLLIRYEAGGAIPKCDDMVVSEDGFSYLEDTKASKATTNDCEVTLDYIARTPNKEIDVTVIRKLNTGDPNDKILEINKSMDLIVSFGANDTFDYHRRIYSLPNSQFKTSQVCDPLCLECTGPDNNQCKTDCVSNNPLILKVVGTSQITCTLRKKEPFENIVKINEKLNLTYSYYSNTDELMFKISGKSEGWRKRSGSLKYLYIC